MGGIDGSAAVVLEPDICVPAQMFEPPGARGQPEKRLMLAVLENAVWVVLNDRGRGKRVRGDVREALEWIASPATDWPFAYVSICDALALDPDLIRAGVTRARRARAGHFPFRRVVGSRTTTREKERVRSPRVGARRLPVRLEGAGPLV